MMVTFLTGMLSLRIFAFMHGTDYDMGFKQGTGTLSASFLLLLLGGGVGVVVVVMRQTSLCAYSHRLYITSSLFSF